MWFRSHRSEVSLDLVPEESSVDSDQKNHDLRGDLRAALAALSVEERSAIVCCSVQGMSHSEAAIVLGWPIGTVKTHLLRGKEKMKLRLADWAPEG
jgi:RNA polymerase sigma-70 factor (ECF subfamily)